MRALNLCICAGFPESSLLYNVISTKITFEGPFIIDSKQVGMLKTCVARLLPGIFHLSRIFFSLSISLKLRTHLLYNFCPNQY